MLILPNYQINDQIYESMNSLVYRGYQKTDNQPVILKMLKQDYPTSAELTRYQQEYEIIHDLNLVGVIKAYSIEKYQNTLIIIVEDFGGESLKQLVANCPLTVKEFLPFAIHIADSLNNIHAANIIHKDINPSNIVVNVKTNLLKIIDFGIASRLPYENLSLKSPEQLEGTLAYISPEQTGRINRSIDYRTDLYSLGVTFYEMLTGLIPFTSLDAMELVHCHLAKTPTPVSEVNPEVPLIISDIIMKLLAKNAEDRYQSALGLKADLEKCQASFYDLRFELGQNDFLGKLQIPQKLYGREKEIKILLQAFERVSDGATEMIVVAGYSGVGKTALVHEIHKPMTQKHGYFAAGKFDQLQRNIPYSAITQAFNEFCRYLLMENSEILTYWQTQILEAVGSNGQIIIDVIPDLELVIGKQPAVAEVAPNEAQNRFNLFFLNFIKALCSKEHPFILFIDDLQWIDSASLALLKKIMLDHEIKHLLIIGAYRDNEVDDSHPFIMSVDELQKAKVTVNLIKLANLRSNDINRLLHDTLKCEIELIQPLTDLIEQKTQGNAFFVHQFLQTLYEKTLLHFDFKQHQWQWNIEAIVAQNITDNVIDLMINKISQLPTNTSKVLQLAACMGNQFELSILAIIYEQSQNETLSVLWNAILEGLIQPLDENYKCYEADEKVTFKFLHDRVQQAAYALIDDEQKQAIHLQIGRLWLKNTSTETLEDQLFDIIGQLNQSITLIDNQAERLEIAKLFLMAGQKAKMATAYSAAINYLKVGRECLTENSWETEYDLTLNLFTETVEVVYLNGDFKQVAQVAQIVLKQTRTLADEAKICETQILAYIAQNQQQKAIEVALIFLERLGISLPEKPSPENIGTALQKTHASSLSKSIQSLIDLPMMTAIEPILAMRIMVTVVPAAYQVLPELMILLVLKQVDLFLEYGHVPESSVSCADYGIILCGIVGDIESGYQFGLLSLNLLQRLDDKKFKGRTTYAFNTFARSWKEHIRKSLPDFSKNYHNSLETGNLEMAGCSAHMYICKSFFVGKPLVSLEPETKIYTHAIAQLKLEVHLGWLQISWRTILNLMGYANNPCCLTDKAYDESNQLPFNEQLNDKTALAMLHIHKCMLHYLFQEYTPAIKNAELAEQYLSSVISTFFMALFYFYDSLAQLAVYSNVLPPEQDKILNKVTTNQEKMWEWVKHAPMNFQHKYNLVEAEKARVLGQVNAMEWYEKAITGAFDNEYLNEQALAYELTGQFYLGRGMVICAQSYLKEAHYRYQQWGAVAKVKDLEEHYRQWLVKESVVTTSTVYAQTATIMASTTRLQTPSTFLDLESIMKAAQTLSGEILLDRLFEKMMQIVIENAGAERGFLLLPYNDKWVVEAKGAIDKKEVTVLHSLPIENDLPAAIINYVARTQENVVLANASQEGLYTENEYIKAHQTQSVLCFPIVYQQQLRAILYLENNLTTGAFTPQRLDVLKMLSSQIAISLENAEYANYLEEKVKQRTTELAQANQKITALNEQLKQENVRMSAELNVAKQLQQMVLPKETELKQIESLEIAGFMTPADEVGGDYYEILKHNGRIKIGIGDVTGHGLESGVLMLMVQTTVRALLLAGIEHPEQFLNIINQTIYHNAQRMGTDKNLTLSLLDYENGHLRLTGQHEEVLLVRQTGQIERIDTFDLGFMIGVKDDISKFASYQDISLQPGDGIVLYTDGITEAQNLAGKLYGIERLCKVVSRHWPLTAQEILQAVVADVKKYIGRQKVFDDITFLILKQK